MRELYFFRNVCNYNELEKKTLNAYSRKSKNKRKVRIVKIIELDSGEFDKIVSNLKRRNIIFYKYRKLMKIKGGIWMCLLVKTSDREIIVMSDGYQYPRFVALNKYYEKLY